MREFSMVTIVKERSRQLVNLLQSVTASTMLPYDIQIVCMEELTDINIPGSLNISLHSLVNTNELPLAAARNLGFAATKTGQVIFVDVDCIVSPTLFAGMLAQLEDNNIVAAYPKYLDILPDTGNYYELFPGAVTHPAREGIPVGQPVPHLQFWSLIFAVKKQTFENIGGFDESFTGYGAEDTDFAMMFNQAGIVQVFVNDFVLHQYHKKYDPPLNHFDAIVNNARRYQLKWNVLPMQRWLKAFEKMSLITIDSANQITVKQKPTARQITKSLSLNPY